jgi:AsmA protein
MRRWGIAAGVAFGAALGLTLGTVAWPVDPGHVAADLAFALGAVDSGAVAAPTRATFKLLPRPTLRMTEVKFRAGAAAEVAAPAAEATLRFDRLLIGEFSPVGFSLRDPDIRIDFDAARAGLKALARPFPRLSMRGGTIEIGSAKDGWSTKIDVGEALATWPSLTTGLRLNVTGRWRAQPVEANLELDAPLEAADGGASGVRLSLDAPLAQIRYSGDWSPGAELADGRVYAGQFSALIPSVPRFAVWLGHQAPDFPSTFELGAHASGDAASLSLADARIVLGGQAFDGALDIGKTPLGLSASGTLAAETVDLEPLIGAPPSLYDESGVWSNAAALPAPSRALDLDLRVSATRAVWGGHALENAAVAVWQREGRFGVKLLDAGFAHGSLSGEISVEDKQSICQTRLEFGGGNISGQGTMKASLSARGRSPAEIVATAEGDGALEMADGAFAGVNFEEALRRGQRRPLDVARDMSAGATRFSSAAGRVEINHGEAHFVDAGTRGPGLSLDLTGAIDLIFRAWRARVEARQTSNEGEPNPDGAHLDFALEGPWATPVLAPLLPPAD